MATTASSFSIRLMFVVLLIGVVNAQLSANFYSRSCPKLNTIINRVVKNAVSDESRMGASLLRLHFHDCFVGGCDGSVLLKDTANFIGEQSAGPNNNSLRGFNVIDTIKARVEDACPGIVSCADIVAVAARDGVVALNGPYWEVPLGRRDSTTASLSAANTQIPAPTLNLNALITSFSNKGFNANEMVALSGGHTIGQARCTTFRNRIYNETNINAPFASLLRTRCPTSGGDDNLSPLDNISPTVFNNDYFKDLLNLRGLLHSDQQLTNGSTNARVRAYSANSNFFETDFVAAMIKMSRLSPLPGTKREIRKVCWEINS